MAFSATESYREYITVARKPPLRDAGLQSLAALTAKLAADSIHSAAFWALRGLLGLPTRWTEFHILRNSGIAVDARCALVPGDFCCCGMTFFWRFLLNFARRFPEFPYALPHALCNLGDLFRTEEDEDEQENDQDFRCTKISHVSLEK